MARTRFDQPDSWLGKVRLWKFSLSDKISSVAELYFRNNLTYILFEVYTWPSSFNFSESRRFINTPLKFKLNLHFKQHAAIPHWRSVMVELGERMSLVVMMVVLGGDVTLVSPTRAQQV